MSEIQYNEIKFGKEAKQAIKKGVDIAANAIKVTLGVTGKAVIIQNPYGAPIISDDGVTVAKSIKLKDAYENIGAQLIAEVANKTNDTAGDGTTTATVLAQKMLSEAFGDGSTISGESDTETKEQMRQAINKVIHELKKIKKDCTPEDIERVATVSSLDPEVGKLISEILREVGNDGVVTVEETQKVGITKEVTKGLRFDRGFLGNYWVNVPEKMEVHMGTLENSVRIFVTDKKIISNNDVTPILEACAKNGIKELLIVAEEIEGEALATLIVNKIKVGVNWVPVKTPGFSYDKDEHLKNIALLTGATVYKQETMSDFKNVSLADFGKARKVIVNKDYTVIVDGAGDEEIIKNAVSELKIRLSDPDLDQFDKARLERHLANLTGGIGVIKVGAFTETEMKAKKYKIEDALNAAKAALEEGIVIGGGSALVKVAVKLITAENRDMDNRGEQIVYESLFAPAIQMAENRGLGSVHVIAEIQESDINTGYNFKTGQLENLMESGIVDPYKVTRLALENAFSIASTVISTEATIIQIKEESKNA